MSSEVTPSSYSSALAVSNTTPSVGVSSTSSLGLELESTPSVPTKNMSLFGGSITFSQIVTTTPTTLSSSIVPAVSTTVTIHPIPVDVESLVVCVVFGVVFCIAVIIFLTIFCLLLKHQRRNDQTRVKSFAVDKVFINMDERGVSKEIGNETLSGGRSQRSTDEDSGDLAKTESLTTL